LTGRTDFLKNIILHNIAKTNTINYEFNLCRLHLCGKLSTRNLAIANRSH